MVDRSPLSDRAGTAVDLVDRDTGKGCRRAAVSCSLAATRCRQRGPNHRNVRLPLYVDRRTQYTMLDYCGRQTVSQLGLGCRNLP